MKLSPCKFCAHVSPPWFESAPQYEGGDLSEIFVYLECPNCHAMTKPSADEDAARQAWQAGEYEKPDWAK